MGSGLAATVPAVTDLVTGPRLLLSLAGIMAAALAASRLLGARRFLVAIVLYALLGWLVGVTLAVVLARASTAAPVHA